MMLGYTLDDLDKMTACVGIAHDAIKNNEDLKDGLGMTYSFLQGLWAEGYFE